MALMYTSGPHPLHLASTAQQMARAAGDSVVFNRVALLCRGVMAVASAVQVLQPLLHNLNRRHDSDSRERSRSR